MNLINDFFSFVSKHSGLCVSPVKSGSVRQLKETVFYIGNAGFAPALSSLTFGVRNVLSRNCSVIFFAVLLTLLMSDSAFAGDQGSEFDDVWNTLLGWAQGTLGKIIALSMMLVGIIAGVARQSIMAFAMGIAAGLGLFYAPGVINGVVSADISSLKDLSDSAGIMLKLSQGL